MKSSRLLGNTLTVLPRTANNTYTRPSFPATPQVSAALPLLDAGKD